MVIEKVKILIYSWIIGICSLASVAVANTNVTVLATSMTKEVGGAITIGGLSSYNIWSNGSIYTNINALVSSSHIIKVKAYGQMAAGVLPTMQILVDGTVVKQQAVSANAYNDYSVTVNLNSGSRRIAIKFINDFYANGEDRNLIVHSLNVIALAAPATTPTVPVPTTTTQSPDGTSIPPASQIRDASGAIWTLTTAKTVNRNGAPAGYSANVEMLVYKNSRIYQTNTAGGWWYWSGSTWISSSDPRGSSSTTQPAPAPTSPTVTAGTFTIRTRLNTNVCGDLDIAILANGARVYVWSCVAGLSNQAFTFTAERDIKLHGKCLMAGASSGSQLIVQDCNGSGAQKFSYDSASGQLKGHNNLCIDLSNSSTANGNFLNMVTCNSLAMNQKFNLVSTSVSSQPAPTSPVPSGSNPLAGVALFNHPDHGSVTNINYCPQMWKIANHQKGLWLSGEAGTAEWAARHIATANSRNEAVTMVIYNIPNRDCGLYSSGGTVASNYVNYVASIARAIGNRKHIVIMEPDAIAGADCLSSALQNERYALIRQGIQTLRNLAPNAVVYLDGGNSRWHPASTMASRMRSAGLDIAHGFALNVSNFITTAESRSYGDQISALTGGKHYVIDTSRNGNGPGNDWCNPEGRALGERPQTFSSGLIDAYLWVKPPGDSDGNCRGYPNAGTFMPQYACDMAARAAW